MLCSIYKGLTSTSLIASSHNSLILYNIFCSSHLSPTYVHHSCACALPLQPLLLLLDLSMLSFHSALIAVIKWVLEEEKEDKQNDANRGLGPYGSCGGIENRRHIANNGNARIIVRNSTNIYEHKPGEGKQSAKEEMQKARTNALQSYLRVLSSVHLPKRPQGLGVKSAVTISLTSEELCYVTAVRRSLYRIMLCVASERVIQKLDRNIPTRIIQNQITRVGAVSISPLQLQRSSSTTSSTTHTVTCSSPLSIYVSSLLRPYLLPSANGSAVITMLHPICWY